MKKMTKVSLILAGISLGLGILLVVIGLMMGADWKDLNDMGIYVSPIPQKNEPWGIELEINNGHHEEQGHSQKVHNSGQSEIYHHSLQEIERLEVEVKNAKITIQTTEDSEKITYVSNHGDIGKKEGSTLKLEDNARETQELELEIYVPIGVLKEFEIEASACELTADKIIADNVTLDIGSASVNIEEFIVSEKAQLELSAGEMVIGYFEGKDLEAECDMGVIKVVCEGNSKDYNYELECGMGNISINEENYSGIGERIRVNNTSDKKINAECSMGEIILEFPGRL